MICSSWFIVFLSTSHLVLPVTPRTFYCCLLLWQRSTAASIRRPRKGRLHQLQGLSSAHGRVSSTCSWVITGRLHPSQPLVTVPLTLSCFLPVAEYQVLCIFKALQKRQVACQEGTTHRDHHCLSIEEFYNFYELQNMRWKRVGFCGCGISSSLTAVNVVMTVPGRPCSQMVRKIPCQCSQVVWEWVTIAHFCVCVPYI